MRQVWPFLLVLACGTPTTTDPDPDPDDTDAVDTDDTTVDTDGTTADTDDTDDEGPAGFSYTYDFEAPSTSSTTDGWDGWMAASNTHASFGVGTSAALDVRGGFSGQVGYLNLSPTGGGAANITVRTDTTWQAPGAGYRVDAMVMVGRSVSQAAGNLTMTLRSGSDTRATGAVSAGAYSVAGQINQPLMLTYTTTAADAGTPFSLEIGGSASCCAAAQHFFESLSWTVTPPAD